MKTKRKATTMLTNEPQNKKPKIAPAPASLSTDVWQVICKFADAKTLCTVERTSKSLAAAATMDKYWQVLFFKQWPIFFLHNHQSCKNWKQQYAQRFKTNWNTVFWNLIDTHHGKSSLIERTIAQDYLDNIQQLTDEYHKTTGIIYDAFAEAGIYLEDDFGMDAQAFLVSHGKKAFDSMIKNPNAFADKYGLDRYEEFVYIWSDSGHSKVFETLKPQLAALAEKMCK